MFFGDNQARLMEKQQPMKMAAAEAIYNTQNGASFSPAHHRQPLRATRSSRSVCPTCSRSWPTTRWDGPVQGINQIQAKEAAKYGPGNYKPILWVTYWTFRIMVGCGILMFLMLAVGLWLMRRRRLERSVWFLRTAVFAIVLPFVANTTGWIFTEMGRQPWVVFGLLKTSKAVSHVGTGYVVATLVGFTAIYSLLAAIDFGLMAQVRPAGSDDGRRGRRARRRRSPRVRRTGRPACRPSSTEPEENPCIPCSPAALRPTPDSRSSGSSSSASLWSGYFVLEGFDFGVGMLLPVLGRDDLDRRVLINTIGPVWDGNEVWLLMAGGATFAAFPNWYATLFSGFYLPLFLILAALIFRGVAFEFRAKRAFPGLAGGLGPRHLLGKPHPGAAVGRGLRQHPAGRAHRAARVLPRARSSTFSIPTRCSAASRRCSCSPCTGRSSPRSRPPTTSTTGPRGRPSSSPRRPPPPCSAFLAWTYVNAHHAHDTGLVPPFVPILAIAAVAVVGWLLREKLEGWAFVATAVGLVGLVATIFLNLYPRVMVSSISPAYQPHHRQRLLGARTPSR